MADPRALLDRQARSSALRERMVADATSEDQLAQNARLEQQRAQALSSPARGSISAAYALEAGGYDRRALSAELSGDQARHSKLRALAQGAAAQGAVYAPEIQSYKDVHGVGDALSYVGGLAGQAVTTMAPIAGAALLTRGKSLGPLGNKASAFMGASVPAYMMEKGEAVSAQYDDPETAAADARLRDRMASGKALVNTLGEVIVPGGLAAGFGRRAAKGSALRTIGRAGGEEAATETLQQGVGIAAHEAVKQGGLNRAALAEPFKPEHREELINAGFAGLAGGTTISLPTAASQGLANLAGEGLDGTGNVLGRAKDRLAERIDQVRKPKAAEPAAAPSVPEFDENMSDEDLTALLASQGVIYQPATAEDPSAAGLASSDPAEVMAAQEAQEATVEARARATAERILALKDVPADLYAQAQDLVSGRTPRELYNQLIDSAKAFDGGQAVSATKKRAVEAIDALKSRATELLDKPLPGTKKSEEATTESPLVGKLFEGLKPEYKDRDVQKRLGALVKVYEVLDTRAEAPQRADYELLQDINSSGVLDLFADPTEAVPKSLRPHLENATRAAREATQEDSWFTAGLTDAFRANPHARVELGKLVDRVAINGGRMAPAERKLLTRAFGSAAEAAELVQHYAGQLPKLEGKPKEAVGEQLDEELIADKFDGTTTERDAPVPRVQHHFSDTQGTPYLGTKSERGLKANKLEGDISPAQAAARALRNKDPSRNTRVLSMLDYVRETKGDVAAEATKLREAFAERQAVGKIRPGEDITHEAFADDDVALLRAHEVLRSEARDNSRDLTFDNDVELHDKARTLYEVSLKAKDPAQRAAAKSTVFTIHRRSTNAQGEETVRPTKYSAESLWKYFGDKQQARVKDGAPIAQASEPDAVRAQNLFAQAIAELAQDPSVESIELPKVGAPGYPKGLVLDRKTGTVLARDERIPKEAYEKPEPKRRRNKQTDQWQQMLREAATKLKGSKYEDRLFTLANSDDPRAALMTMQRRLDEEYELTGPALAYRVKQLDLIREAMHDIVDTVVPKPDTRERTDAEKLALNETGYEDPQLVAMAKLDQQEHYARELKRLTEGLGEFELQNKQAQKRLGELERKVDALARKTDEIIGVGDNPLVPSTKEAAFNASGLRAQQDEHGLLPATAPRPVANPELREAPKQKKAEPAAEPKSKTPEFDKLPAHDPDKPTMTYAGVGSRETPPHIMAKFRKVAARLEELGYTLRTGDAQGADSAFAGGAKTKEVFTAKDATDTTRAIAKEIHPAPGALRTPYVLNLMARNTNQVFGRNLDTPADFVLVWTKDGSESKRGAGGTGQAMELAQRKGIPVINAAREGWELRLKALLDAKPAQAEEVHAGTPAEIEQSFKTADKKLDAKPSEDVHAGTPAEIEQSFKTADKKLDAKQMKAMQVGLLAEIDAAIASAPAKESGHVTFDVPGDGKFKVVNSKSALETFRNRVARSEGFKPVGRRHPVPRPPSVNPSPAERARILKELEAEGVMDPGVGAARMGGSDNWFQQSLDEQGKSDESYSELKALVGDKVWADVRKYVPESELTMLGDGVGIWEDEFVIGVLQDSVLEGKSGATDKRIAEQLAIESAAAEAQDKAFDDAVKELHAALPADPRADALVAKLMANSDGARIRETLGLMRSRSGLMRLFLTLKENYKTPAGQALANDVKARLKALKREIDLSGARQSRRLADQGGVDTFKAANEALDAVLWEYSLEPLTSLLERAATLSSLHTTPLQKQLLKALSKSKALKDVGFRASFFGPVAFFDPGNNAVVLSAKGMPYDGITTLIHEATHAMTMLGEASDSQLRSDLNSLLNHVRTHAQAQGVDLMKLYGMSETQEFLAEAFSNPEFQALLRTIPALNTKTFKNAWQQFVSYVAKLFGEVEANALSEALTIGLQASVVAKNAKAAGIGYRPEGGGAGQANMALGTKRSDARPANEDPLKLDPKDAKAIIAELKRIGGKDLKVMLDEDLGGTSGEYNPVTNAIRIALGAVNPLSTGYHESLHHFFRSLHNAGKEGVRHMKALEAAASTASVREQLAKTFKDHPEVLAQIESDAEERVAYVFQLWAMGKIHGKPLITIGPAGQNVFRKIARWISQLVGAISNDEKAIKILEGLYEGKFSDPSAVGEVLKDMKLDTLQDKMQRMSGPLADVGDKLLMVSTDRLRSYGHSGLSEIANSFKKEPGRETGKPALIPRTHQVQAKFLNELSDQLTGYTNAEMGEALRNLQAMKAPSSELERKVVAWQQGIFDYMTERKPNGRTLVQRFDAKTKEWVDLKPVDNYFTRVWDRQALLSNQAEFEALLMSEGNLDAAQANATFKAITTSSGDIDVAQSEYHAGYTPMAAQVENRRLDFIVPANAEKFVKFQDPDMYSVLTSYARQAVHRTEFAREFGNAGERIEAALQDASKSLKPEELLEATNAIKALSGTLGSGMNPRMNQLMSTLVTAQNVILLPLTMFAQVMDAVGVGVRANKMSEAWSALGQGFKEIGKQVTRSKDKDYSTWMAETVGAIESEGVSDTMMQLYAGSFMSKGAKRVNNMFFRLNGLESWNRGMRVAATAAGARFVLREKGNGRYMRELGLEESDVMTLPDGHLAVTAEQMRQADASLSEEAAKAREARVQQGLYRFVDGAVLRPDAASRPPWMSDPHWMLVAHLKQFTFAFQKTILARVGNELDHNNAVPAMIAIAYVPTMMAMGLLKSTLTGQPIGDGSFMAHLGRGITRSGLMGTSIFYQEAAEDLHRGNLPGTSFLGPTLEHAWMAGRYVVGDPRIDSDRILDRSIPLARHF